MFKLLMMKWFNLEEPRCETCEVLKMQLAQERQEKEKILELLLDKNKPMIPIEESVRVNVTPPKIWAVRKRELEEQSRQEAALKQNKEKELEELEKEVLKVENS
jgi:hypothetical protein